VLRRGFFYEYRRAADRHPRRVRFTHHGQITNGVGVCDIFGGIESVILVRGPHPTDEGRAWGKGDQEKCAWFFVPGSSFEELASQGPVREGQKPKSNGVFGLQPIMHDLL